MISGKRHRCWIFPIHFFWRFEHHKLIVNKFNFCLNLFLAFCKYLRGCQNNLVIWSSLWVSPCQQHRLEHAAKLCDCDLKVWHYTMLSCLLFLCDCKGVKFAAWQEWEELKGQTVFCQAYNNYTQEEKEISQSYLSPFEINVKSYMQFSYTHLDLQFNLACQKPVN